METRFITSKDGAKIAYSVIGDGPPLLLVHGGVGDYSKKLWFDTKWIDKLKSHFTIITPDVRGNGESEKSEEADFYMIKNIIDDFNIILNGCNVKEFYYIGWSYGATIGFQMCKLNNNIKKAICAGSIMGENFSKNFAPSMKKMYEEINNKKKTNSLHDMNFTEEERKKIEEINLDMRIAQFKAWENWPVVEPSEINTKLAIYSGTKDYKDVVEELYKQENELVKHNITLKIFNNLNHFGLISEIDTVIPWILDFLNK